MIFCNERIFQQVTSDFLQRATSATINKWILPQVTSDFLQRATFARSNERILLRVTSDFLERATSATINGWILQRVTSDFLQRATFARSNERFWNENRVILQRVTSNELISMSNEQRVKSYTSSTSYLRNLSFVPREFPAPFPTLYTNIYKK